VRTGTVAGRLLVEFGDQPESAIKKVRDARPGAIETAAQERYVRNCRPVASARAPLSQEERALACLLGGALGDASGYEVEFRNLSEIHERFGPTGIETPVLHHGNLIVSDDTQMTLFTLEGLLRCLKDGAAWEKACIPSIREAYLDWLRTQGGGSVSGRANSAGWLAEQPQMRVQRAPGNTCLSALHSGGRGSIGRPINNSKGCGGAMRTAPIGLLPLAGVETVFQLAAEAAALTHGHPSGYLSAGMVAAIVRVLMDGGSLAAKRGTPGDSGAMERCREILRTYGGHEETLRAVDGAVKLAAKGLKDHAAAVETLGGGWVGEEALAIALYAVLSAGSFVEAIKIAANHSGDSDSTASIAGQLWGAANGLVGMSHDWVSNVDVLLPLLHLARQLTLILLRKFVLM
jgi:ADP-ribosylglycohydrolase